MSISSPSTQQGAIYQNFIGGEWRNSRGSETFASTNPAHTSEVIGRYQRSTASDIKDANRVGQRFLRLNAARFFCVQPCC